MQRFTKILVFFLIGLALIAGAGHLLKNALVHKNTDRIAVVTRTDLISRVTVAGVVNPRKMTTVSPPYSGYIRKLYVKLGQKVKTNDPLVTITPTLQGQGDEGFPQRAPFDGTVVQLLKTEGEYIDSAKADSTTILKVYDLTRMFIQANVSEGDIDKIKVGLPTVIRASGVSSRTYKGIIREIFLAARDKGSNWGDNANLAEFPIKIEVLDSDAELLAGMSAIVDIIVDERKNVLTIPHEFVARNGDKRSVTLEDGRQVNVSVGGQNEELLQITSGLSEGQRIRQIDFLVLRKAQGN